MQTLSLTTNRLLIRNLKDADLDDFHSYRSDSEVMKYQGSDVMDKQQAAQFIHSQKDMQFGKPGEWVQYALEEKSSCRLIGDCAIKLQEADPRIAEIGITIHPLFQRKGLAKEAMHEILRFLFEQENLHRVVETVDAENISSIKLLESLGFRKEGHFMDNVFYNGRWASECQFALLGREWIR